MLKSVKGARSQTAIKEVVKHLRKFGATDQTTDEDGNTPLHFAAGADHTQIVKYLLKSGSDPTQRNSKGQTPADSAPDGPTKLKLLSFKGLSIKFRYISSESFPSFIVGPCRLVENRKDDKSFHSSMMIPLIQRACDFVTPREGVVLESNYKRKPHEAANAYFTNERVKLSIEDRTAGTEAAVTLASSSHFPQILSDRLCFFEESQKSVFISEILASSQQMNAPTCAGRSACVATDV